MPKSKQADMFAPDLSRYKPFEGLPEDYPFGKFQPAHSLLNKTATVRVPGSNVVYKVDLGINECQCKTGFAFWWDEKKQRYIPSKYCIHKLRVMASVMEKHGRPEELDWPYVKALGSRYNRFETVSAFHKELRRGDVDKAWFWASMLTNHRGLHGIIKYLVNILYEETRDHQLGKWLLELASRGRNVGHIDTYRAVAWFCAAKKKWELPQRLAIFKNEMLGYRKLADEYSPSVAKAHSIIPFDQNAKLRKRLQKGYRTKDPVLFQQGLKGLFKSKFEGDDHIALKDDLFAMLWELAETEESNGNPHPMKIAQYINDRIDADMGIGYHELNALGDSIMGESYSAGNTPAKRVKVYKNKKYKPIPLGYYPSIPLYAQDNHTYRGKFLIRKYPEEMQPGADMKNMDLTLCGAYFGVAWRMQAYNQHNSIDIPWSKVKWDRNLYNTVNMLWY